MKVIDSFIHMLSAFVKNTHKFQNDFVKLKLDL